MKNINLAIIAITLPVLLASCNKSPKINSPTKRPNVLWIITEDMSSDFGYHGDSLVDTPNVNKLADEGVIFTNAYVTAPVCSTSRSALITGMYQTSIGAQNHCSSQGTYKIYLPDSIQTIPELFRNAGYYTSNCTERFDQKGKEDYNFVYSSKGLYDGTDWTNRAEGQPFFAQVQLRGGKLRNIPKWYEEVKEGLDLSILVKPVEVSLPPYYPHVPAFTEDWAEYLNSIQYTDKEIGILLQRLKKENLLSNTVIFFITDHGISQARGKQLLYDEGTKIPFIVWAPGRLKHQVRNDLISHIDMSATSLELAGIKIPEYMDGKPLFGDKFVPRDYIVCARDRCDETVDHIRSVRKGNFKYIKNYLPDRPYLQPNAYKDHKPWMPVLRELDAQGKLNNVQKLVTAKTRPEEELYDLFKDPFEIHNLARNPKYLKKLADMRSVLDNWIRSTDDKGQYGELEESYNSSMEVYLNKQSKDKENHDRIEKNIKIMKKWAADGR